jgi:CDP-6-deoxy-D-xylo-4-hexulose-3-dehydrase
VDGDEGNRVTATAPPAVRYPLARVTYGPEEIASVTGTLVEGRTTMGPRVAAFEAAFAEEIGAVHGVMVNSGSSADLLAAFSLGPPKKGLDEVLVPAVTWPTQVWACLLAGYRVRLVDTDPHTLQMDLDDLERKITWRSAAVFPVHVLGACGHLTRLLDIAQRSGLAVLEDCCEALGTRYWGKHVGTFGSAGAFSFFFSHLLSTMEGGMVTTDDAGRARMLRLWRSHGWDANPQRPFHFPTWGLNVRPTEVQGAFGLVQLGRMAGFLEARRRNHERLTATTVLRFPELLRGASVVVGCEPAWHGFPLTVREGAPFTKAELCRYLDARGVETRPLIAGNLARQPGVEADKRILTSPLPGADAVHERAFYIGLASHDDEDGAGYVGECVRDFVLKGER